MLDVNQAAAMTGYKPSHLYQLVNKKSIPFIKTGHKIQFRKEELEKWMLAGRPDIMKIAIDTLSGE